MQKIIILIVGLLLLIYSVFVEPNMLVVNKYKINDSKLSGVKIVFFGDLHLKQATKTTLEKSLKKLIKKSRI